MKSRFLIAGLCVLAIGCGKSKKKDASDETVKPVQPTAPVAPVNPVQPAQPLTPTFAAPVVGLFQMQQADGNTVYLRIDNDLKIETTKLLPVREAGSNSRMTMEFPHILKLENDGWYTSIGFLNRGGNTGFDNVTLKVRPVVDNNTIDVRFIMTLRQGDVLVEDGGTTGTLNQNNGSYHYALEDLVSEDGVYNINGHQFGYGRCHPQGTWNDSCRRQPNPIPALLPILIATLQGCGPYPGCGYPPPGGCAPGYPGCGGYPIPGPGGGYPIPGPGGGYPIPGPGGGYPIPGGEYPIPGGQCPNGQCQPLETKEFTYRFYVAPTTP